jgi:hypothetical protein
MGGTGHNVFETGTYLEKLRKPTGYLRDNSWYAAVI